MALTSVAGEKDLPRWFETFFSVLQRLEAGAIEIGLPDGRVFAVSGKHPGPTGRIDVANPEFFTRIARDGDTPVNPSGGLIGGGHPVGATGARMLVDAVRQVSETADGYQIPDAGRVQTLNIGGSTASTVSLVVERAGKD